MAMRSALYRIPHPLPRPLPAGIRRLSDERGRILSEEERAKENVYIQKMERERLDKAKKRIEKEKDEADKAKSSDHKAGESNKK